MEPQVIVSTSGHHLPRGGEGLVVISKVELRMIIIYSLLSEELFPTTYYIRYGMFTKVLYPWGVQQMYKYTK